MGVKMNKGILFVLTFDVLSAAQSVWLGSLLQGINVYNILFINFSIITIIFAILNYFHRDNQAVLNLRSIMNFLILNVATLGSWLFLYISLRYMEPALTAATLYGINPLATLIISVILLKQMRNLTPVKLLLSIFTIICMLLVGYTVSEGHSGLANVEHQQLILGFIMAILTGFCMATVNVVSKKIYDSGFTLYQLMSMRFFLLLIVSFYFSKELTIDLNTHLTAFMIIAIFGNVVPLFMLQKGIALISPVQVSYILLLTPLFVFAFQIFDSRLALSIYSLIAIISVVVISFIGLRIEKKQEEKTKQQLQQEE
ncbi:hypothetical protein C5467_15680 [Photorhabdus khanii subsp. guanajuatensis]|uniref:EamA domain-containing protein n=2 Tax=Photorhabdus khanii TaxID=1004150 RepID=A0A4V2X6N9_9GAMM|nr:hypothetical protein C5467_15680 [Photorhabdus khanii subsp. guanajuatensis]